MEMPEVTMPKISKKMIFLISLLVGILIMIPMIFGINNAGYRTVVQWPNGTLFVKFEPGLYFQWFGNTEEYPDVITIDFDKTSDETSTVDLEGIAVRYQDGGLGTIYGKDRFALPTDEKTMLDLHKAFRSAKGLAFKLIKPVTEEAMNMTAGLMTSEAAYAEQRGSYIQQSEDQIKNGKYKTRLESKMVKGEDGKDTWKQVPVIALDNNNQPIHLVSDLKNYGLMLTGHQVVDWGFEEKTLAQISAKREATMAIITAKANAERAKQDAITAEEQGKANVMEAKYLKEVEKQKAVVEAQKTQQVAVIEAQKRVDVAAKQQEVAVIQAQQQVKVAEQVKLEAEQKKFAAKEYKQEQILRGEGDAEYKKLVMQADGALQQKLDAYVKVMQRFATEFGKQKWVPEIQMGAQSGPSNQSAAQALIEMLSVKTAKDLSLELTTKVKQVEEKE